jgi:hypothetical protein
MDRLDSVSSRPRARSPLFFVGKNSQGHWVVQDQDHLRGGLFVDRAEALRFALFENGNRPQAVIMAPGVLEIDMSATPGRAMHRPVEAELFPQQRAA